MKRPLLVLAWITTLSWQVGAVLAQPTVHLKESGRGAYEVDGRFAVKASSAGAWRLLSDYDHIGNFVSSIDLSRVRERHADYLLLEQTNRGGAWFLRRNFEVVLKVKESPPSRIDFEDVLGTSFESYRGSWEVESRLGQTEVRYHLQVQYSTPIPSFLLRSAIRKNIIHLLEEVSAAIEKKEGG